MTSREDDPERFFDRGKLVVPSLAAEVQTGSRIRLGVDGKLYRYDKGVYRGDGREWIRARVLGLLGERYARRHRDEVLGFFGDFMPTIGVDQPAHRLNVLNGSLDWHTGELHEHSPSILSTIQLPVEWHPDAECPRIDQFFDETLPGMRDFMYEVFGYAIYARLPIHKALLLFGKGRNGKGTTLRLLKTFIGAENVAHVPLQVFGENRFAAANVHGKLVNLAGDLDARDMQRSDAFKMLTGGDAVYAEHKNQAPFTFTSFALQVFAANEAPISRDQTEGYFSRWLIVPFVNEYVGDKDDTGLDAKLQAKSELEGLLVRAVDGLRSLLTRGRFLEPEPVKEAGEAYRTKLDSVASFVDDECEIGEDFSVTRADLYRRYKAWSDENGRRPLNSATFYEHLLQRFPVTYKRTERSRLCLGIKFTSFAEGTF